MFYFIYSLKNTIMENLILNMLFANLVTGNLFAMLLVSPWFFAAGLLILIVCFALWIFSRVTKALNEMDEYEMDEYEIYD